MTPKLKAAYQSAKRNKDFLRDFELTGEREPTLFSDSLRKHLFVAYYCGWMLARHGKDYLENM